MVTGRRVVQVEAVNMWFVADLGEGPGLVGHKRVPGPESHSLLLPAGHKIPSVDHTAWPPCLQRSGLAFPLDIAGDLVGHNPVQGNQALVVDLLKALAVTADRMGHLFHMADPSFFPSGPWNQEAGFLLTAAQHFQGS